MKKILYKNEYRSGLFWGHKPEHLVKSYVEFSMYFDFKDGLRFCISVPNVSFCYRNPFKALFKALEHESIGMSKYQQLKDDIRRQGRDKNLECYK
jgi:hypothetical protein